MSALILAAALAFNLHAPVNAIAFSPDGSVLAAAAADGTVRTWSTRSPGADTAARMLRPHRADVDALAFSPDGSFLASSSYDGIVTIEDVNTGATRRVLDIHPAWSVALAFVSNSRLAVGMEPAGVAIYDVSTGLPLRRFTTGFEVYSLAASPDRARLAVAPGFIYDLDGALVTKVLGHHGLVYSMVFLDEDRLLTSSWSGTALLQSVKSGSVLATFAVPVPVRVAGPVDRVVVPAASPVTSAAAYGDVVVTGSADRAVRCWNANTGALLHVFPDASMSITGVAVTRDGSWVAAASADGFVRVWRSPCPSAAKATARIVGAIR